MEHNSLYNTIINNLEDGVYFVDHTRRITMWNRAAERITGFSSEEVVGSHCQHNLLNHIDLEGRPLCLLGCPLFATLGDGMPRGHDVLLRHRDGHRIAVKVKILPIHEDGKVVGAVEIFTPKSEAVHDSKLVDALSDIAMTDQLTGLPNRKYMESLLRYRLQIHERFGSRFCVVFLDIDNFSVFNNTYGHNLGDEVLKSLAASFKNNLREADKMGRWGGEEFVGLFGAGNGTNLLSIAEKVRVLVENSEVRYGDENLRVTASVGATCVRYGDTPESVVQRADALMYRSKKSKKNSSSIDDVDILTAGVDPLFPYT